MVNYNKKAHKLAPIKVQVPTEEPVKSSVLKLKLLQKPLLEPLLKH